MAASESALRYGRLTVGLVAVAMAAGVAACASDRTPGWTPATPRSSAGASAGASGTAGTTGSPKAGGSPIGTPGASAASAPSSPSGAPSSSSASGSPATTPAASAAASPSGGPPSPTASSPAVGGLPQGSDPVTLDPANFVAEINHPYWPMPVGAKWTYSEVDADGAEQRVDVEVLDETKQILGITATVVHDQVTHGGELIEDTMDWYAQDAQGNLWYLGEDTKEYEGGKVVSTEGSWEAGVDGAQAGIILPASPAVGQAYRQEYYAGQAEDNASILSVSEFLTVDAGDYQEVLLTRETTPLEPDVLEYKFYAPGVGVIQALSVSPDFSREQLTEVEGL